MTAKEFSLKGETGMWMGMSDQSTMLPGPGTFEELRNLYISKDGTEIRRMPGSRLSGRPFLGQPYTIDSSSGNTPVRVVLTPTAGATYGDNYMPRSDVKTAYVKVDGNYQDPDGIPDGIYVGEHPGLTTNRGHVDVTVTISGSAAAGGKIYLRRGLHVHALGHLDGRPIVIAETEIYVKSGVNFGNTQRTNVAAWVGGTPLDVDTPLTPSYPDTTDNPTDAGFILFRSPTMENTSANDPTPDDYPATYTIERRMTWDTLNGQMAIAAPGMPFLWQVDLRYAPPKFSQRPNANTTFGDPSGLIDEVPDHRWMKALGIPKGVQKSSSPSVVAGAGGLTASANYYIRVGYMDTITGEVGLAGEAALVTTGTAGEDVLVEYLTARGALAETMGLSVVVYSTEANDGANAIQHPVALDRVRGTASDYEAFIHDGAGASTAHFGSTTIDAEPDRDQRLLPNRLPLLELMPKGGGWVKIVRSRLFTGGAYPDEYVINGRRLEESVSGTTRRMFCTLQFTPATRQHRYALTAAYGGHRITDETISADPAALGMASGSLIRKHNSRTITGAGEHRNAWEIDFETINERAGVPGTFGFNVYLELRPDLVAYSEEAFLGVAPATNRLEIDRTHGRRAIGMARWNDMALVFTDRSAELFTWSSQPRKSSAQILSHVYGCISPSSIVEGPFGAAWLSHEGPCMFGGGQIRFIGRPLREFWKTLRMQDDGLMQFSIGAVDLERELVVWTVRRAAFTSNFNTSDTTKSKSPCDTLIMWSYATNQFSVSYRDGDAQHTALTYMPHAVTSDEDDARWRLSFMTDGLNETSDPIQLEWPIYSWEETSNDRIETPPSETATADRIPNSDLFDSSISTQTTDMGVLDHAYIRGPGGVLRWWGTLDSFSGGWVLDGTDDADWKTGDVLEAKILPAHIITNKLRFSELGYSTKITGVVIRADLIPAKDSSGTELTQYAWARVRLEDKDGNISNISNNHWGDPLNDGTTRFRAGYVVSTEIKVYIDLIGNGQIHIKDIAVEAEP